jgi:hypothetical protein
MNGGAHDDLFSSWTIQSQQRFLSPRISAGFCYQLRSDTAAALRVTDQRRPAGTCVNPRDHGWGGRSSLPTVVSMVYGHDLLARADC